MAKLVFGMSQSLDGYVDDAAGTLCMPAPSPAVCDIASYYLGGSTAA